MLNEYSVEILKEQYEIKKDKEFYLKIHKKNLKEITKIISEEKARELAELLKFAKKDTWHNFVSDFNKKYEVAITEKQAQEIEEAFYWDKKQIKILVESSFYNGENCSKSQVKNIEVQIFKQTPNNTGLVKKIGDTILKESNISSIEKIIIKNSLTKIIEKNLFLLQKNGFANNIFDVDNGLKTANQGDATQFLFISRAILAGYNCSNVDLRTSKYDAVIDYKGKIFKVQVKGISESTVSFMSRARGGQGIDHTHENNKSKKITNQDCDIYVAVDKQVGICYIIPINDPVITENNNINVKKLEKFRENWDVIANLCCENVTLSSK